MLPSYATQWCGLLAWTAEVVGPLRWMMKVFFPSESRRSLDCSSWSKFITLTSVSFLLWKWSMACQPTDTGASLIENPNDPKQKLRHHRRTEYFDREASAREREGERERLLTGSAVSFVLFWCDLMMRSHPWMSAISQSLRDVTKRCYFSLHRCSKTFFISEHENVFCPTLGWHLPNPKW